MYTVLLAFAKKQLSRGAISTAKRVIAPFAANVLNARVKTSTRKALKDGSTHEKHELSSSGAVL